MRPGTLAEVAERSVSDTEWEHHLLEFLDEFYARDGDTTRQGHMIAHEPDALGDPRADAYLGGVGEHLARRWGLSMPDWVRSDGRHLSEAWFVPDRPGLRGYLLAVSPVSFRNRLIFTGPDPLQRARFPYRHGILEFPGTYSATRSRAGPSQAFRLAQRQEPSTAA